MHSAQLCLTNPRATSGLESLSWPAIQHSPPISLTAFTGKWLNQNEIGILQTKIKAQSGGVTIPSQGLSSTPRMPALGLGAGQGPLTSTPAQGQNLPTQSRLHACQIQECWHSSRPASVPPWAAIKIPRQVVRSGGQSRMSREGEVQELPPHPRRAGVSVTWRGKRVQNLGCT